MYKLIIPAAFLAFSCLSACSTSKTPQSSSPNVAADQWYGWSENKRYNNPGELYLFTDSMFRFYGDKVGYLMSVKSFHNMEMTLEYRWNMDPQSQHGSGKRNSGVMYNVPDTAADHLWPAGIQFQVKEGATGDFILLENTTITVKGESKGPGKSVTVPRFSDHDKPSGEWNSLLIRTVNGHCYQYLNGVLVNEGINSSTQAGRVLLQYEGSPIDFRNIQIKELP